MSEYYRQARLLRQSLRDQSGIYLIVEDDPKQSYLLRKILEKFGKKVETVSTVTDAKELVSSLGADKIICAIIDVSLPDGEGTDVAAWLSSNHPEVPFFLHSVEQSSVNRVKNKYPHVEAVKKGDIQFFMEMVGINP